MHGTTFGGGPLACAVAIEFLRELNKLLDHVGEVGGYFCAQLEWLKAKHSRIREVRGMGLMLAMELDSSDKAKAVASTLLKKRILINRTHETVLRFLPPYIIQEKHVDEVIRALDSALTSDATKRQRLPAIIRAHKSKRKESQ
jgi:acetylornithine aminotransferase/acetylornithine/N-succinyldiaminopimelate aminotransferase